MIRKHSIKVITLCAALVVLLSALPGTAGASTPVQVLSLTTVVARGGTATLAAHAPSGVFCDLVVDGRSLGSRKVWWGTVRWSWSVPQNARVGSYRIQVKCGAATAKTKYRVV